MKTLTIPRNRIIAAITALAVLVTALVGLYPFEPMKVSAASDGGTFGDSLTWSIDTDSGVLTITGSGAMPDFGGLTLPPWAARMTQ